MIQVVSGWIQHRYSTHSGWDDSEWTRFYRRSSLDGPVQYLVTVAVFSLETHSTKTPVWRSTQKMRGQVCPDGESAAVYLDQRKTEFKGKFVLLTSPFPWVDGLYPNKALDKWEIVQMFPECKKMPRPYAMDYVRDRG